MRDASLRRDDPVAHRVVNKLGQRMESKLEHDVSPGVSAVFTGPLPYKY